MSRHDWMICPTCNGEGKHSRNLGSFTSSEWNEMDDDFRDDYMTGAYDSHCNTCGGSGKVLEDDGVAEYRHNRQLCYERGVNAEGEPTW